MPVVQMAAPCWFTNRCQLPKQLAPQNTAERREIEEEDVEEEEKEDAGQPADDGYPAESHHMNAAMGLILDLPCVGMNRMHSSVSLVVVASRRSVGAALPLP